MMIHVSDSPIGRNIRYLRRKKYISCAKLARLCGMPYRTLHFIEKGIMLDIDFEHLKSLCSVLGLTLEDLIEKELKL